MIGQGQWRKKKSLDELAVRKQKAEEARGGGDDDIPPPFPPYIHSLPFMPPLSPSSSHGL